MKWSEETLAAVKRKQGKEDAGKPAGRRTLKDGQKAHTAFVNAIIKRLEEHHGLYAIHTNAGGGWGWAKGENGEPGKPVRFRKNEQVKKGFPDVTAFLPTGRAICIEAKTGGGDTDWEQKERIYELACTGVLTLVARTMEEVDLFVENHKSLRHPQLSLVLARQMEIDFHQKVITSKAYLKWKAGKKR